MLLYPKWWLMTKYSLGQFTGKSLAKFLLLSTWMVNTQRMVIYDVQGSRGIIPPWERSKVKFPYYWNINRTFCSTFLLFNRRNPRSLLFRIILCNVLWNPSSWYDSWKGTHDSPVRGVTSHFLFCTISYETAKARNCFFMRPSTIKEILNPESPSCGLEFHESNVMVWFCNAQLQNRQITYRGRWDWPLIP